MMPLISIIIPVYNAEKYIRRCVDSVIAQSYKDWELILVDDGSTDKSGEICDEYAEKDERIRVFHKTNGGASSARNVGLDNATGDWVYFCDSDDELYPNTLDVLSDGISENVDMVNAGYVVIGEDNKMLSTVPKHLTEMISVEQMLQRLVYSHEYNYQGYLVTKLFRNDLIKENGFRFNIGICYNEDRLFVVQYLSKCSGNVWFSTENIYKYIFRPESATQSMKIRDAAKLATSILANILILDELNKNKHDKETLKLWKYSAVRSYFQTYNAFVSFGKPLDEVKQLKHKLLLRTGCLVYAKYKLELYSNNLKSVVLNKLK